MAFIDACKTYASYEEIFGARYPEEKLIEKIKDLPAKQILNLIVQLSELTEDGFEDQEIRKQFIIFLKDCAKEKEGAEEFILSKIQEYVLYTPQSLLVLCKWILAHGDFFGKTKPFNDARHGINMIIYLSIIVSDYMTIRDSELLPYEMVRNYMFNKREDYVAAIARSLYLLEDIAKDKDRFNEKEYLDINKDFSEVKGYSISEYVAFLFAMFGYFNNSKKRIFDINAEHNIEHIMSTTKLNDKIPAMLDEMTLSLKEAQDWSLETITDGWNFSKFWEKPFLALEENIHLPILPRMLYKNLFQSLKIVISKIYDNKTREKYNTFFGRLFEHYVQDILSLSLQGKTNLENLHECSYSGKYSPDGMVRENHKLLAIEAKAKLLNKKSIFLNDNDEIYKDIEKLVIKPLCQLDRSVKDIYERKQPYDISNITETYFLSVTISGMPVVPPLQQKIYEELTLKIKFPVKRCFYFDIEEFELFCYLMYLSNALTYSIFNILERYIWADTNFNLFLHQEGLFKRFLTERWPVIGDIFKDKIRSIGICIYDEERINNLEFIKNNRK